MSIDLTQAKDDVTVNMHTEADSSAMALEKTGTSKNITAAEWNSLVYMLAYLIKDSTLIAEAVSDTLDAIGVNVKLPPTGEDTSAYNIKEFLAYLNARLNSLSTTSSKLANYTYSNWLLDDIVVDAESQTITFKYLQNEEAKSVVISFDDFNADILSRLSDAETDITNIVETIGTDEKEGTVKDRLATVEGKATSLIQTLNKLDLEMGNGEVAKQVMVGDPIDMQGMVSLSEALRALSHKLYYTATTVGLDIEEDDHRYAKTILTRLQTVESLIKSGGLLSDVEFDEETYTLKLTFVIADDSDVNVGEDDDSEPDVMRIVEVDLSELVDTDEIAAAIANLPIKAGSGTNSSVEGSGTVASAPYTHAEGLDTHASGKGAHAEGYRTYASGSYSHAEGQETLAEQQASHVEGCETKALYQYAHAEGYLTTASSQAAHAEGYATTASGWVSHAEGNTTVASGHASHAQGKDTEASGEYSFASGLGTVADGECQTAFGKYNVEKDGSLFVVGNGKSATSRSNAFEVFEDGTATLTGLRSPNYSGNVTQYFTLYYQGKTVYIRQNAFPPGASGSYVAKVRVSYTGAYGNTSARKILEFVVDWIDTPFGTFYGYAYTLNWNDMRSDISSAGFDFVVCKFPTGIGIDGSSGNSEVSADKLWAHRLYVNGIYFTYGSTTTSIDKSTWDDIVAATSSKRYKIKSFTTQLDASMYVGKPIAYVYREGRGPVSTFDELVLTNKKPGLITLSTLYYAGGVQTLSLSDFEDGSVKSLYIVDNSVAVDQTSYYDGDVNVYCSSFIAFEDYAGDVMGSSSNQLYNATVYYISEV